MAKLQSITLTRAGVEIAVPTFAAAHEALAAVFGQEPGAVAYVIRFSDGETYSGQVDPTQAPDLRSEVQSWCRPGDEDCPWCGDEVPT